MPATKIKKGDLITSPICRIYVRCLRSWPLRTESSGPWRDWTCPTGTPPGRGRAGPTPGREAARRSASTREWRAPVQSLNNATDLFPLLLPQWTVHRADSGSCPSRFNENQIQLTIYLVKKEMFIDVFLSQITPKTSVTKSSKALYGMEISREAACIPGHGEAKQSGGEMEWSSHWSGNNLNIFQNVEPKNLYRINKSCIKIVTIKVNNKKFRNLENFFVK